MTTILIAGSTATVDSSQIVLSKTKKMLEAYGTTSAGAGSATVLWEARNTESSPWKSVAASSLTLSTTASSDLQEKSVPYIMMRARITAITGTGATVSANIALSKD